MLASARPEVNLVPRPQGGEAGPARPAAARHAVSRLAAPTLRCRRILTRPCRWRNNLFD